MRLLIQRVLKAEVKVGLQTTGSIDSGLLVFVGFHQQDEIKTLSHLVHKLFNLRIFSDANGKMNESIQDAKRSLLIVSQFTLYADCSKGNRPSFINAASFEKATALYEEFLRQVQELAATFSIKVETGKFGADMKVSLVNDGPVTILLESETL